MDIVALTVPLYSEWVDLMQEDDVARFLGVHIECNLKTGFLNLERSDQTSVGNSWPLALMLDLQTESSHIPKESILPNLWMESLTLVISTSEMWLEWSYVLLDTCILTLLSCQLCCTNMFCPKLVHKHALN